MGQAYSNPKRASDPRSLPDVEVFYADRKLCNEWDKQELANLDPRAVQGGAGEWSQPGWYYWFCFPGCMPDSDPIGPFKTEVEALADAQSNCDEED